MIGFSYVVDNSTSACECKDLQERTLYLLDSDSIFLGKVKSIEKTNDEPASYFVKFDVDKVWNGSNTKEIVIKSSLNTGLCAYPFEVNQTLVIHASKDGEILNEKGCGTLPVEYVPGYIKILDERMADFSLKQSEDKQQTESSTQDLVLRNNAISVHILEEFVPKTALDWVLLVSSIASVVLVGIVWMQTSTARKESNSKMRPWLRIDDVNFDRNGMIKLKTGYVVKWSEHFKNRTDNFDVDLVENITVHGSVINGGSLPTYRVKVQSKFFKEGHSREILRKSGTIVQDSPLMPQETIRWRYVIEPDTYLKSMDEPIYVGAECTYEINKDTTYKIGKIWKISGTTFTIDDYWAEPSK